MDKLEEAVDGIINQPIEGLLYDLDLMPEQCKSERSNVTRIVIEKQRREIERLTLANKGRRALTRAQGKTIGRLKKEKEWLLKSYVDNLLIQSSNVGYMKLRTDLIDDMQQALKEGE